MVLPDVKRSEQAIQNLSFDETYNALTFIPMVEKDGALYRQQQNEAAASHATGQVSVGTTATQIAASRTTRKGIVLINLGSTQVFVGGSGVTAANGLLLEGITGASIFIPTTAAIYGITASGTQTVSYMEIYG